MILEKIQQILAQQFEVSADSINADTNIVDDLGADSLDVVERLPSASVIKRFDLSHLSEINGNPMGRRSYFVYFQASLGSMGAFWPLKSV